MTERIAGKLDLGKKALLAAAGVVAVVGPVAIGLMYPPPSRAQQPGGVRPSFEVASVKSADPNERGRSLLMQRGGRLTATNASLKMLLAFAYDVRNYQISGGPAWLDSARYIEAKADSSLPIPPGPAGGGQMRPMIAAGGPLQAGAASRDQGTTGV